MFQFDALAREATDLFLSSENVTEIKPVMKIFAFMPLTHHENIESQKRCLREMEKLLSDPNLDGTEEETIKESTRYTRIHLDIIEKFGRYPHRNFLLDRTSTADEIEYLKTGMTFGVKQK